MIKITYCKRKGHHQNLRGKKKEKDKQSMQRQAAQLIYLTPQVYLSGHAVMSTNDGKGFFTLLPIKKGHTSIARVTTASPPPTASSVSSIAGIEQTRTINGGRQGGDIESIQLLQPSLNLRRICSKEATRKYTPRRRISTVNTHRWEELYLG